MVSDGAEIGTDSRPLSIERVALGAGSLKHVSSASRVSVHVQGCLIVLQDLLALGRTLFEQGSRLLADLGITIHEQSRFVRVELPGLNVSILHGVEEQAGPVGPPTEQGSCSLRSDLRTHFPPLR